MTGPKPVPGPVDGVATMWGDEDAAVERILKLTERIFGPPPSGELWVGDDAAVVEVTSPLLLSCDAVVEGVHFDLAFSSLEDVGWKALTVAVSDIAAMGGCPTHAVCTMAVPQGTDVERLAAGVAEAGAEWSCRIVGGDLTSASQIVLSVTVTGRLHGTAPAVRRSGAAPGDELFVTGPLGASAAGLRNLREGAREGALVDAHRRPRARLAEGMAARRAGVSAMMDVSDGLALDLRRLAHASGVGVALFGVPVAAGATESEALGGGEDYELLMATRDPDRLAAAFQAAGLRPPLHIGACTADVSECTLEGRPMPLLGWQHAIGRPASQRSS